MKAKHFWIYGLALVVLSASGCNKSAGLEQSTVSVSGTGAVSAPPDMVQMTVSLNKTAKTTRLAQEEVSKMAAGTLYILKTSGVEDKDIRTASLTFNQEYRYPPDGRRILVGQRAEQRVTFSVHDILNNSEKISQIIDRLIQIDGIVLEGMNFSIKNNTEHFAASRELAFQKARQKAEQYAALSGLQVKKVLSISEEGLQQVSPRSSMLNQMKLEEYAAADAAGSTVLPAGEMEITSRISVVFLLE